MLITDEMVDNAKNGSERYVISDCLNAISILKVMGMWKQLSSGEKALIRRTVKNAYIDGYLDACRRGE